MDTQKQIQLISEIVTEFFDENAMYTGIAVSRADGTCIKALKFFVQLMNNVGRPNFD